MNLNTIKLILTYLLTITLSVTAFGKAGFELDLSVQSSKKQETFNHTRLILLNPKAAPIGWESQFKSILRPVQNSLASNFHPQTLKIVSSPNNFRYDLVARVLSGSISDPIIATHEVSHAFLDHYLRKNSEGWNYFLVMQATGAKNVDSAIETHERNLENLSQAAEEFKEQGDEEVYQRISKNIKKSNALLVGLNRAKEHEERFAKHFHKKRYYRALTPYHELFADALTAVVFQDWNSMAPPILRAIEKNPHRVVIPEGMTFESYANHRTFQRKPRSKRIQFHPRRSRKRLHPIRRIQIPLPPNN